MAAARKNKFGKKREDDLLARSAAVRGARGPGSIFAFGSDRETGRIGQIVQGRLVGPGGDRLAGTGIGRARPTAADIRAGDLRKGIPIGPVGRAAQKVLAQAPAPRGPSPAAPAAPAAAPATQARRPNLAQFPALAKVMANRRGKEERIRFLQANPRSGRPGERQELGLDPTTEVQEQLAAYNAAVAEAQRSDVEFEQKRELADVGLERERLRQEALTERLGTRGEQRLGEIAARSEAALEQLGVRSEISEAQSAARSQDIINQLEAKERAAVTANERELARDALLFEQRKLIETFRAEQAARPREVDIERDEFGAEIGRVTSLGGETPEVGEVPAEVRDLNNDGTVTNAEDAEVAKAQRILSAIRTEFPDSKPEDIELKLDPADLRKYRQARRIMKEI